MKHRLISYWIIRNFSANVKIGRWIQAKGYCKEGQSVEDTAKDIGISRETLAWFCRCRYGLSIPAWRKKLRIMEAIDVLDKEPDIPIQTLAHLVGISDRSNFRKQFTEVTGFTPSEWIARKK